jgi:hypothetical protein
VSTRALRLLDADVLLNSGAVRLRRPDLWALKALRARPRCARCGCAWCEAFEGLDGAEIKRKSGPVGPGGSGRWIIEFVTIGETRHRVCRPAIIGLE